MILWAKIFLSMYAMAKFCTLDISFDPKERMACEEFNLKCPEIVKTRTLTENIAANLAKGCKLKIPNNLLVKRSIKANITN